MNFHYSCSCKLISLVVTLYNQFGDKAKCVQTLYIHAFVLCPYPNYTVAPTLVIFLLTVPKRCWMNGFLCCVLSTFHQWRVLVTCLSFCPRLCLQIIIKMALGTFIAFFGTFIAQLSWPYRLWFGKLVSFWLELPLTSPVEEVSSTSVSTWLSCFFCRASLNSLYDLLAIVLGMLTGCLTSRE